MGGCPRMEIGSKVRSRSRVGTESGCGSGVTIRRYFVSTFGTFDGVMLNSLPMFKLSVQSRKENIKQTLIERRNCVPCANRARLANLRLKLLETEQNGSKAT